MAGGSKQLGGWGEWPFTLGEVLGWREREATAKGKRKREIARRLFSAFLGPMQEAGKKKNKLSPKMEALRKRYMSPTWGLEEE